MHYHSKSQILGLTDFDTSMLNDSPLQLCSYLPDRASKLSYLLLDTNEGVDGVLYTHLAQEGFRRSGAAFYRPDCRHCLQCISCRVPAADFKPSRRYRKVLNRNKEVSLHIIEPCDVSEEHYRLYQRYIIARHADGDMYPPSRHTFEQFLVNSPASTLFIEYREPSGQLIAVAVTDKLSDGLSSVYTFFDPSSAFEKRSLGVYGILQQITLAQQLSLDYVYLGYWIPDVKKMRYKTDYTPIELLINGDWQRFDDAVDDKAVLNQLNTFPVRTAL